MKRFLEGESLDSLIYANTLKSTFMWEGYQQYFLLCKSIYCILVGNVNISFTYSELLRLDLRLEFIIFFSF